MLEQCEFNSENSGIFLADADNASRRRKTRTKHTKTCENGRIFTKSTWHYIEEVFS